MTRKAIVQIGTEKTGSTTLQSFFANNRAQLAERGFLYPRFCGAVNHTGLAAFAMNNGRFDPLKQAYGASDAAGVPAMRDRMRKLAEAELEPGRTALFCSEHCHSRLIHKAEVTRLRDFLSEFFDEIQISVYLRRQDLVAVSLYSTVLKSGGSPKRLLPDVRPDSPYYNYDRFLSLWEDVFGADALSVRLFDRDLLERGSIIDDVVRHWNLGPMEGFQLVPNQNSAISKSAQDFLKLANPHLTPEKGVSPDTQRGQIISALERSASGRGARPSRDQARAFYDTFRDGNAAVAARYFPDREALFSQDFSQYPDQADPLIPDAAAIAQVAAALLVECQKDTERLEAQIAIRDAAIAWRDDQPDQAITTLREALVRAPEHPGLNRSLGEYLLRAGRPQDSLEAAQAACRLAPANWEFRHFLGVVLAACDAPEAAAEAQRAALALNPGHPAAERALATALARCKAGKTAHS